MGADCLLAAPLLGTIAHFQFHPHPCILSMGTPAITQVIWHVAFTHKEPMKIQGLFPHHHSAIADSQEVGKSCTNSNTVLAYRLQYTCLSWCIVSSNCKVPSRKY
jgi:hypothetical protein